MENAFLKLEAFMSLDMTYEYTDISLELVLTDYTSHFESSDKILFLRQQPLMAQF